MTKEEREERGTVYGTPAERSPAGHNALLGLAMFGAFIGAVAPGIVGAFILGGSMLLGGVTLLTHPHLWGK